MSHRVSTTPHRRHGPRTPLGPIWAAVCAVAAALAVLLLAAPPEVLNTHIDLLGMRDTVGHVGELVAIVLIAGLVAAAGIWRMITHSRTTRSVSAHPHRRKSLTPRASATRRGL